MLGGAMRVRIAVAVAVLAGLVCQGVRAAESAQPPKLIVAISVDQFSGDVFAEYRQTFTGGLKRLLDGVVFPAGYQSHAATETCPGHSTILTGARPSRSGIIANTWVDLSLAREDKKVYCTEDPSAPGSSSKAYVVSPKLLKAQTLGDRMKAVDPGTRVVAVAGKDRSAVMMGGHHIDEAWFWKDKKFGSFADRIAAPPAIIGEINTRLTDFLAKDHAAVALPEHCRGRSQQVHVVEGKDVGVALDAKAGDPISLNAMIELDRATADIAIDLVKTMKLGGGTSRDVLVVGLSATDYVGHIMGTSGAEMCIQMAALDEAIGRILSALDETGAPYAVVLTADHGGHDLPERNKQRGFPKAERLEAGLAPDAIGAKVTAKFGLKLKEPLLYSDGPFGDWYVSRRVTGKLRTRVIAEAKALLAAHRQVQAVMSADELKSMPSPQPPVDEWSLAQRLRASFDPTRSGDLLVVLKPHVTPITDAKVFVATHGSPWNYDRRVPIVFYRPGTPGFEQPLSIETVDIMPTLAGLIGLKVPAGEIDGRCLDLDPGPGSTCP